MFLKIIMLTTMKESMNSLLFKTDHLISLKSKIDVNFTHKHILFLV